MSSLKIISWNIRQGGGSRIKEICQQVTRWKAQILILSEFRNNDSGRQLRTQLLKLGYRYQWVTGSGDQDNAVAIFSLLPGSSSLLPESDQTYGHNILVAHFPAFSVMGVYLPHKKKHSLLPYIKDYALAHNQPLILAGDLNTGINGVDQKGSSFWYEDELKDLASADLEDTFRHLHGNVTEYSWYSHQGNGYRYDHTYTSTVLRPLIKACYYDHSVREDKVSDHSAMVLELGVW